MLFNIAILHVVLAVIAVILISQNPVSTKSQKGFQFLLATLLPVIGPVITTIMTFYVKAKASPQNTVVGRSADEHLRKFPGQF